MPRRLILLRHAQAAPASLGDFSIEADMARPLTADGQAAALRCGQWLAAQGLHPDAIVCSPARRTRQTLDAVLTACRQTQGQPSFCPDIYEAQPEALLARIQQTEPQHRTLLLVGHNPGISLLARQLDPLAMALDAGFDPGSIAVFVTLDAGPQSATADWANGAPECLVLHTFTRP